MGFNATLPEGLLPEGDVEGMKRFLSTLVTPVVPRSFYAQMYFGAGTVTFLALVMIVIVIRRLQRKSAWLVQFYQTPQGLYVLPNAVMIMVVFLFGYALVYATYACVTVEFYRFGRYKKNYVLFRCLPWSLLFGGAWLSSLGSISAFPDALRFRGTERTTLQWLLLRPAVFHSLLFGPLAYFGTLLIPALQSNSLWNRTIIRYETWLVRAADPATSSFELTMEARGIWLAITRVYWLESITFTASVTWVCVLAALFSTITFHTLLRIRAQVKLAEKKTQALSLPPTFYLFSSRGKYAQSGGPSVQGTTGTSAALSSTVAGRFAEQCPSENSGFRPGNFLVDEESHRQRSEFSAELFERIQTDTATILFPGTKPRNEEKLTSVQAATRRCGALKLVYRNLMIQYAALSLGITSFGANALVIPILFYPTARTNTMGLVHAALNLTALWISCICGVAIIGAVVWRSFDPAFILGADQVEEVELPTTTVLAKDASHTLRGGEPKLTFDTTGDSFNVPSLIAPSYDLPLSSDPELTRLAILSRPSGGPLQGEAPMSPRRSRYGAWRDAPQRPL